MLVWSKQELYNHDGSQKIGKEIKQFKLKWKKKENLIRVFEQIWQGDG